MAELAEICYDDDNNNHQGSLIWSLPTRFVTFVKQELTERHVFLATKCRPPYNVFDLGPQLSPMVYSMDSMPRA